MSRYDDEVARKTRETQNKYEAWAARERAKGNDAAADRLQKGSDSLGRVYGGGTRGGSTPKSGGCAVLIIAVAALGTAGAAALQAWSAGGFS